MENKLILLNIFIIVIISCFEDSHEECVCNVRLRGEYCGTELNRRNANSDCEASHMYFCGDNNKGRSAKLLVKCKDELECESNQFSLSSRARRRNPCRKRLNCHCPSNIGRGPHCGKKLIGDCPPDMLFICRRISGIDSRDYCPDGCNDGKCILAVDDDNRQMDGNRSEDDSDTEP